MADISLSDLASNLSENTGDAVRDVANKAGNFACGLYRDYPAFFLSSLPRSSIWYFWEKLCSPRNMIPPVPGSDFKGGQCPVRYTVFSYPLDQQPGAGYDKFKIVWGSIQSFRSQDYGNTDRPPGILVRYVLYCLCYGDGESPTQVPIEVDIAGGNFAPYRAYKIERTDGLSDNCGDPPPKFPDVDPPLERLRGDTQLTIRPGLNLVVPLVYLSPKLGLPDVNVGDINVKFDIGGVTLKFGGGGGDAPDLAEIIRRLADIEADTGDTLSNLKDLTQDTRKVNKDLIDDINRRNNKEPEPDEIDEDEPDNDKDKRNIEYLRGVQIVLTKVPENAKMQYGIDAPNLYYAGWFEFRRGELLLPREPINFLDNYFVAPEGANGFAYTLAVGYEGYNVVVKNTAREVV